MNKLFFFWLALTAHLVSAQYPKSIEVTRDTSEKATLSSRMVLSTPGPLGGWDGTQVLKDADGRSFVASTAHVLNCSQMRSLSPRSGVQYWLAEKGRQGWFEYDPADQVSTDDGVLTLVAKEGKRLKRVITSGTIPAEIFGLDSLALDNSQAFASACQIASQKGYVLSLPSGKLRLNALIRLSNVTIKGNNTTIINSKSSLNLLLIGHNVSIDGVRFDGGFVNGSTDRPSLILSGSSNVNLTNCMFFNSDKTGVRVAGSTNVKIQNCTFQQTGNNLQFFDGGSNIIVDQCSFLNSLGAVGTSGANGISFNRNASNLAYYNVRVTSCFFKQLGRMGIEGFNLVDAIIEKNDVDDMGYMGMSFPNLKSSQVLNNRINNVGGYGLEIPEANGRNFIFNNTLSNPKDNGSLNEAIILSSFVGTPVDGATDNKYNTIQGNRIENWLNAAGTRRSIKLLNGNTGSNTLNSSYVKCFGNTLINSGSIVTENMTSTGHEFIGNRFIQDASAKATTYFLIVQTGPLQIMHNTVNYTGRKGRNQALPAAIVISNSHGSTISYNQIELDSCFNYGIKDSDGTSSVSKEVSLEGNSVSNFRIDRVYFRTPGSTVAKFLNNGVLNDYRNINNYYLGKYTEVLSLPNSSVYAGYDSPEGMVPGKLGSLFMQAGGLAGNAQSRGHVWIKNHQVGNQTTMTGWSLLDGGGAIRDTLLLSISANFSTLNNKYAAVRYPVGTIVSTPYTENGAGNWWVRLTDTNWLKLGSSFSKTEADDRYYQKTEANARYQLLPVTSNTAYTAGAIAAGGVVSQNVSLTATLGQSASSSSFSTTLNGVRMWSQVTALNTVTHYFKNESTSSVTPSGTIITRVSN